ncbi:hypothetical protein B9479_000651 [Cryptococcus floricola]|uniref:Ribonuclease H2 subunit B n=1 Tax=Cryptococcus floricola TaxID=2591691 RepID=A0A5D3B3W0_9TREE|nr:hypothetical protein B9479_000651 [Cryptococcus floricola]
MDYISIIKDDVDLSQGHQYLRLPHPRSGAPQLYLPYTTPSGQDCVLEAAKLNGASRRTWFVGESGIDAASILVHYPVDPLFLVIPLILSLVPENGSVLHFQPLYDLLSTCASSPSFILPEPFTSKGKRPASEGVNEDLSALLKLKSVKRAFRACCEVKIISAAPPSPKASQPASPSPTAKGEKYYRPSIELVVKHLKSKVEFFAKPEEFEKFDHLIRAFGRDGMLGRSADDPLLTMARKKAAIEHLSQWLSQPIVTKLIDSYDFTALHEYLASHNAALAAASQPITKAKKGAKETAATKRKASSSRGVESLKKVNTSKMTKLTSFFKPKEPKEKK